MANRLHDKVAIVTGGTSGIGKATAHLFAREGAKVVFIARGEERGREVQAAIRKEGGEATFIACDIGDVDLVEAAVAETAKTYGAIHIIFNNAGGGGGGSFPNSTNEDFNRLIKADLNGAFYFSRAVWPHLVAAGGGAVVNMSSLAAQHGFSPIMREEFGGASLGYYAAKSGIDALTRYMAAIGGKHNIRGQRRASRFNPSNPTAGRRRSAPEAGPGTFSSRPDPAGSGLRGGRRESRPVPSVRRVAVHHRADHQRRRRSQLSHLTLDTRSRRGRWSSSSRTRPESCRARAPSVFR